MNWTIATEINVKTYEVEFSTNGIDFVKIGEVAASQNSLYGFVHMAPVEGYDYYRIKIVDNDGYVQYTVIRTVRFVNNIQISVYPNPATSQLNIALPSACINKEVKMELYDQLGQLMIRKLVKNAQQTEILKVVFMPSGVYDLRILLPDNNMQVKRIQIIRR